MRRWLFFILGIVSVNFVFSQGNLIWPSSSCLDNLDDNGICEELVTNANATIAIQASSFSNITLEGYDNIPTGSYIGVFYGSCVTDSDTDNNGLCDQFDIQGCGGFSQWPELDENFVIAAYGDDPFTSVVDGFVSGQPYTWFLRINNSDNPLDGWTDYIGENLIMDTGDAFQENWLLMLFQIY